MLIADLSQSQRTLGCEYEFTVPLVGNGSGNDIQRVIAHTLTSNGVRAIHRAYSHEPVPDGVDVAVEHDSSVLGETRYSGITWPSVEVKTRKLAGPGDWEQVVPRTLDICRYLGGRTNRTAGHHIHIGLPEVHDDPRVLRSLYNFFHRYQQGDAGPSHEGAHCYRNLEAGFRN